MLRVVIIIALSTGHFVASSTPTRIGVHLSDFHLDPFFGTATAIGPCTSSETPWFGKPGCDSSAQMVQSAIDGAASVLRSELLATPSATQTPIVYYTGDWLRHDMASLPDPVAVGEGIVEQVAAMLAHAFSNVTSAALIHPSTPVAYGNEDFIPDYHFNVSQAGHVPFMHNFSATLLKHGLLHSDEQAREFAVCGYTSYKVDSSLRVLTLNTLVYSTSMFPPTSEDDPCGQFAWMKSQLTAAQAANETVHLVSHIPPSVLFWKKSYYESYRALVAKFTGTVAAQFYGHIHRFLYMVSGDTSIPPIFIGGPVTRVSHTWPDFTVMPMVGDHGAVVEDRVQWAFDDKTSGWNRGSTLKQALNLTSINSATLASASHTMMNVLSPDGNTTFTRFFDMVEGGVPSHAGTLDRLGVPCFTMAFDFSDLLSECLSHVAP